MTLECVAQNKSFGGWHKQYQHQSHTTACTMRFAIYLPPQAEQQTVPVLYWLSGLTCSDENFMQKAGAQRIAAELGIAIVAPDTSPRGDVADDASYDLGQGAGFYLTATQPPWHPHYDMYHYVVDELPALIEANFPVNQLRAISGHSMGGHGAITIGLTQPDAYRSVSAFSPICNPSQVPWGEKAFSAYLGTDRQHWLAYDSCALMSALDSIAGYPEILIDQGLADAFLDNQLKPEALEHIAKAKAYPLQLRRHAGYDHSYYFIATFIEEHLHFHAQHLK